MIELKNVSKFYNDGGSVTVGLKNINLKLNKGEFVAITGDSGSGKSTLLNVISLIDTYDEGEILFYGSETFYFNQNDCDAFRKNNVSFIFQKYNIIDSYSVLQNVMLPLLIKGKTDDEAKKEATEIIKRVGLEHRIENKGTNLSGGEKQRCVIARALAADAPILVCDEPTGNLDSKTSEEIIKLIKEVSKDKLVLIVTHDYESVKNICTRKIKLSDGEIVEDVTFKDGLEEENKELVLTAEKPPKKTLLKLALSNILSTPKKTVFTSMVFTFVACLFLLLSLFMVQIAYEENYTYSESYGIIAEDRMIVYSAEHDSLDMTKLQPLLEDCEYYENAFFEEKNNQVLIGEEFGFFSVSFTFHDIEFELMAGVEDAKEGDFILLFPDYAYFDAYTSMLDQEIFLFASADYDYQVSVGKLVGVGVSDELNNTYLMGGSYDQKIANISLNNDVNLRFYSESSDQNYARRKYDENAEKCYFEVPSNLKDDYEFQLNIKGLYSASYDFETVYKDGDFTPSLIVNTAYLTGEVAPNLGGVKEITVYTDDVQKLSKEIDKLGYAVSVPSMVENNDGASLIVLYMLSIVIAVALVILFYISFAILQKIYLTKTKDYSIFRTLGLVSKDLKKMLTAEVMIITFVSILLGAVLTNLVIIVTAMELYEYVSVLLLILYALTMSIFGLLTAYRLNDKIFKNSVYQAIKDGGE